MGGFGGMNGFHGFGRPLPPPPHMFHRGPPRHGKGGCCMSGDCGVALHSIVALGIGIALGYLYGQRKNQ